MRYLKRTNIVKVKPATCIVNVNPATSIPADAKFVGMEVEPNKPPRYKKLYHPWFNLPCYESKSETNKD